MNSLRQPTSTELTALKKMYAAAGGKTIIEASLIGVTADQLYVLRSMKLLEKDGPKYHITAAGIRKVEGR